METLGNGAEYMWIEGNKTFWWDDQFDLFGNGSDAIWYMAGELCDALKSAGRFPYRGFRSLWRKSWRSCEIGKVGRVKEVVVRVVLGESSNGNIASKQCGYRRSSSTSCSMPIGERLHWLHAKGTLSNCKISVA